MALNSRLAVFAFWATITSIVVTLISVAITYWAQGEPEARVNFETVGDTNVLDLHRPLRDLNVVFRGHDVQEQNLNLRIMTINVVNSGEEDILPIHYDPEDGWGMQFSEGEVIEVRLVDSNSEYLRSKIVPNLVGLDTVIFPKVIFETGSSFTIEALLLHPKGSSPSVFSVGKIAGIDEIAVTERPLAQREVSFWAGLFPGNALTQAVRTIIYLPGSLLAIALVILALVGIVNAFSRVSALIRRRRVLRTRTILQINQAGIKNFLVEHYSSSGTTGLTWLRELINEPSRITWLNRSSTWVAYRHHNADVLDGSSILLNDFSWLDSHRALSALDEFGILQRGKNDIAIIDPALGAAVDALLEELNS